ncbi:cytochrome c-type biogenesis protein CcmH [Panacagrimonas perspica]|uniref:Cytochrome c-type biogenesis protein CcmH n=1 Tax=Panacagrimonas perspica TaxID=381431 RepID=A0A4V3F745_9GAMM|nr:c-type cytochrome biogenesis protein CcmI [Panacagrimonas perspica]TDU31986.1 cytochrome c-type biogenesis protein CcmH [Panacagrimonas perspica]THD04476.1 c-type cytochrome biogenesis protein CcmI [Panacagrimonas perspica]
MLLGLMGLLFVAAIAWMTRPLWRGGVNAGQRRRAANVVVYRQRLAEVEADAAAGLVDAETATGLRDELDARLLLDTDGAEAPAPTTSTRSLALTALVAVFVLGVAVAGYFQDGSWKVDQQIASAPAAGEEPQSPGSVDEMVAKLAARLEKEPGDPQGWALLGRSYFVMQRYDGAAAAYARANELTEHREPDLLVNEGESLGLSSPDRDLRGRPQQLFEAALAIAPTNGKALWYAGMAAMQDGDSATAKARWAELSKQDLPTELRTVLDERLVELGVAPTAETAVPSTPSPPPDAAESKSPAPSADALLVRVSVAPELQSRIPPDATLFVFAKAQEGPPMPLAVSRGNVGQLPREIRLDDSMAMTPAAKLTQFDRWTVTARISRAGQALAVSGDLQGSLTAARSDLGKPALVLTIDTVVP